MAQEGKQKGLKPAVEVARQAFLYGQGDGKQVSDTRKLAELSGLHTQTILKHMPGWLKEREEIISNSSDFALGLSLSKEVQSDRDKRMTFLSDQIKQIMWEMDNLDNVIEKLESICGNFSLNTENGDDAIKLFDRYLRASLNKANLRSQFLALHKQWADFSGVLDVKDISVVRAREIAKGQGKMQLKKLEAEENQGPKNITRTGVFARPAIETQE